VLISRRHRTAVSSWGERVARSTVGFSAPEVARACGLSVRIVQRWVQSGLIRPSVCDEIGRGNYSRYDVRDVLAFSALAEMRKKGVSLQALRQAQRYLRSRKGRELQDVTAKLVWAPGDRRYRHDIALVNSETDIESLHRVPGQRIAPVTVPVGEIFQQVRERLHEIRSERKAAKSKQRGTEPAFTEERALRDTERIAITR